VVSGCSCRVVRFVASWVAWAGAGRREPTVWFAAQAAATNGGTCDGTAFTRARTDRIRVWTSQGISSRSVVRVIWWLIDLVDASGTTRDVTRSAETRIFFNLLETVITEL
jgi:hypothetical protein